MAKHKLPQWLLPLAYMLAFGIVWYSFQHFPNTVQPKQVPYSNFLLEIRSGHVSEVAIDEQLFVATLKTPEVLDAALMRAGRFDRQISVDRPDLEGREAILKIHVRKVTLSHDADLKVIAQRTPGMVGADLANNCQ